MDALDRQKLTPTFPLVRAARVSALAAVVIEQKNLNHVDGHVGVYEEISNADVRMGGYRQSAKDMALGASRWGPVEHRAPAASFSISLSSM